VGELGPGTIASKRLTAAEGDRPPSTSITIATVATSIAAIGIGWVNIGRSFNYDEAVTYVSFVQGGSPWKALTTQFVFNNHQMFSVIQAVAWRLGLVGETSQRLLPVMCGAAAAGLLTSWVGRRTDALAGSVAGLILVGNPVFVHEFRTLRGYSLATLSVLVAAVATERSWRDHRTRWVVGAAIAMAVAVTTHAYSVLPIVVVAVVTAALGKLRVAHVIAWLLAAISALLLQLPLLDDARRTSAARGSRYRPGFGMDVVEAYLGEDRVVVVITATLAAVGLCTLWRRSRRTAAALAASIGLVTAAVLLLWQVIEPADLYPRFFVALAPYLAALTAFGVHAIPNRVGVAAAGVALALLVPNVRDVVDRTPRIREAAALVDAARADGRIVCGAYTLPLSVYTTPVRDVAVNQPGGPAAFDTCELFVAVIPIGEEGREVASEHFAHWINFGGGILVYSDVAADVFPP
jgi:hypothetical protein